MAHQRSRRANGAEHARRRMGRMGPTRRMGRIGRVQPMEGLAVDGQQAAARLRGALDPAVFQTDDPFAVAGVFLGMGDLDNRRSFVV
jgi:hypothetical protein